MESSPHHPESEPTPEMTVDTLPEALGYTETEELARLSAELVEAMRAGADTVELATRYVDQAQALLDQADDERLHLGFEIRLALLRRDGGRIEDYLEGIEAASMHAWQMRLDEVAWLLDDALPDVQ